MKHVLNLSQFHQNPSRQCNFT